MLFAVTPPKLMKLTILTSDLIIQYNSERLGNLKCISVILTPAEVAHGPMLIGFVFNVLLYGIMIAQVYLYYVTYKKDKNWMKAYVAVLFFADSLNTVFDFVYMYRSLIVHFGDVAFLGKADWVFATGP